MFWTIMGAGGGKPSGELAAAIDRDLGGMERLMSDFNAAGGRVFGSGLVFVTVARDGKLAIATRPNQDSPLMWQGARVGGYARSFEGLLAVSKPAQPEALECHGRQEAHPPSVRRNGLQEDDNRAPVEQ
jgi:superoxide dismutase